jgi:hypothetical protein
MNYPSKYITTQFIGAKWVNRRDFFGGKQVGGFEFEGIIQVSSGIIIPEKMGEHSGQDKNRDDGHS